MKYLSFTVALTLLAANTWAVDYEYCPQTADGKISPPLGYEITGVKTSKSVDVYKLAPSEDNPYGGVVQTWHVHKDETGRIVKIESGGDKPSQKLIDFELKKRTEELNASSRIKRKVENPFFALPNAEKLQQALSTPTDSPIKFGASIELGYKNNKCYVSKVSDKLYHPSTKSQVAGIVFDTNRCDSVKKLYQSFEKEITECSQKFKEHEKQFAAVFNPSSSMEITSGAGGGGGAPMRSIASVEEESFSVADYLSSSVTGFRSKIMKEKELCDAFAPQKASAKTIEVFPSAGGAVKQ